MNDQNVYYTGFFIDDPQKLFSMFKPKHNNLYGHHSTNKYKPRSLDGVSVGKKVLLKIIGRAYDDKGDALLIENDWSENEYPHITLSCADGTTPQYSNELLKNSVIDGSIEMFKEPKYIEATEGYVIKEERVILS